jgi:hypothetical protein
MRNLSLRFTSISIFLSLVSLPVFAQNPSYHLQFSDGTSGWVILVNDSQKPIEAFTVKAACGTLSSTPTYDALEFSGGGTSHPAVKGLQPSIIQPGQRFFALVNLAPQPSGCAWQGQVAGVIYADGTYDGEESAVRDLQARRAGIAAALQYWTNVQLLGHEQTVAANGPSNAENLSQDDLAKTWAYTCRDEPAVCAYWSGRRQVDQNVAHQMKHNAAMAPYLDRWTAKFDADEAFKKLQLTFPSPISERDASTRLSSAR